MRVIRKFRFQLGIIMKNTSASLVVWFQESIIVFSLCIMNIFIPATYLDNVLEAQVIRASRFLAVHPVLAMSSTFVFMKFEFHFNLRCRVSRGAENGHRLPALQATTLGWPPVKL
jgi:hypothetical protein